MPLSVKSSGCTEGETAVCCCLQEELPAQNKMKVGGHNGFLPYMAVANGIAGSLSGPSRAAVSLTSLLSLILPLIEAVSRM